MSWRRIGGAVRGFGARRSGGGGGALRRCAGSVREPGFLVGLRPRLEARRESVMAGVEKQEGFGGSAARCEARRRSFCGPIPRLRWGDSSLAAGDRGEHGDFLIAGRGAASDVCRGGAGGNWRRCS